MSLTAAAVHQYDVLRALILRETRAQYAKSRLGYLTALIPSCMWVVTFYAMFALGGRTNPRYGMALLPFLATGICSYEAFQKVSNGAAGGEAGPLGKLPRVTPLDAKLAKALTNGATLTIVFLILVSGGALISGELEPIDDPLIVVWGLFLACALGLGLGLLVAAGKRYSPLVQQVRQLMSRPLFFSSGLFFVAEDLPSSVRDIVLYNPILHAIELVRRGWFPSYQARYADSGYALAWAAALLLAGLALERSTRGQIQ